MKKLFTGCRKCIFIHLQNIIVPRITRYSDAQRQDTIVVVEDFLATKSTLIRIQIILFLFVIQATSLIRFFKPISQLDKEQGTTLLNYFFDSPIPILRKGFWGISTLTKLSIYGVPNIQKDLGYYQPTISDMKKEKHKNGSIKI